MLCLKSLLCLISSFISSRIFFLSSLWLGIKEAEFHCFAILWLKREGSIRAIDQITSFCTPTTLACLLLDITSSSTHAIPVGGLIWNSCGIELSMEMLTRSMIYFQILKGLFPLFFFSFSFFSLVTRRFSNKLHSSAPSNCMEDNDKTKDNVYEFRLPV